MKFLIPIVRLIMVILIKCWVVVAMVSITGCSTVTYDGPKLSMTEEAVVYNGGWGRIRRVAEANIKSSNDLVTKYSFRPGVYTFLLEHREFTSFNVSSASLKLKYYRVRATLRPGMVYIMRPNQAGDGMCFVEDAFDAPGSGTNVTGEFRTHSPAAKVTDCGEILTENEYKRLLAE